MQSLLEEVEAHVPRRQNIIAKYIVTRMILGLYEEAVWRMGCGSQKGDDIRRYLNWRERGRGWQERTGRIQRRQKEKRREDWRD